VALLFVLDVIACGAVTRCAEGDALRWAQKDEEGLLAPPTSLWTPIPPSNAGEV